MISLLLFVEDAHIAEPNCSILNCIADKKRTKFGVCKENLVSKFVAVISEVYSEKVKIHCAPSIKQIMECIHMKNY